MIKCSLPPLWPYRRIESGYASGPESGVSGGGGGGGGAGRAWRRRGRTRLRRPRQKPAGIRATAGYGGASGACFRDSLPSTKIGCFHPSFPSKRMRPGRLQTRRGPRAAEGIHDSTTPKQNPIYTQSPLKSALKIRLCTKILTKLSESHDQISQSKILCIHRVLLRSG
jgi:hypothetical protein